MAFGSLTIYGVHPLVTLSGSQCVALRPFWPMKLLVDTYIYIYMERGRESNQIYSFSANPLVYLSIGSVTAIFFLNLTTQNLEIGSHIMK